MDIQDSFGHTLNSPVIESWRSNPRLVSGRSNKASGTAILTPAEQGIPRAVTNVAASSTKKTYGGAQFSQINITHNIPSSDTAFHHANVWVTGIGGSTTPQLTSGSTASPHTLILPSTGEQVSLTVQSVGKDGSLLPLSKSPSTTVTL